MDPRKRAWIWSGLVLAAGVGLVSAASSREPAPGATPQKPTAPRRRRTAAGARFALLGDSFAQGLALPLGQLARDAQVALVVDGRQGARITDFASSAPSLSAPLDVVLVSLGTNDMKMQKPDDEAPLLDQLLASLRRAGKEVIWIAPPALPFPDRGVRRMIAKTAVPSFASDTLVIPRGPDGIHPTAFGYAGWAGAIWRWLG